MSRVREGPSVPTSPRPRMRLALDAMGGDGAPGAPIVGALNALESGPEDLEVILVGDAGILEQEMHREGIRESRLLVYHAPDRIETGETPMDAIRKKPRSSISVGFELHASGEVEAFISAGNTGAVMAQALLSLGRLPGVSRPGIASTLPTQSGFVVVIDVGANVDCKPVHLLHFAHMGSIYAEEVLRVSGPKVGLLSLGEEPGKGNAQTQAAFPLLERSGLNFLGNVEGRDVVTGRADVIVCDGFVGNIVLKLAESLAGFTMEMMREEMDRRFARLLGGRRLRSAFQHLARYLDFASYGGAPLLGVDGTSIICHGASPPRAFQNAIEVARLSTKRAVNQRISETLGRLETEPRAANPES